MAFRGTALSLWLAEQEALSPPMSRRLLSKRLPVVILDNFGGTLEAKNW